MLNPKIIDIEIGKLRGCLNYGKVNFLPGHKLDSKTILDKFDVTNVSSDGNCGYYAIMNGLIKHDKLKLKENYTIKAFRKDIYDHGLNNFEKLKNMDVYKFTLEKVKDKHQWWNDVLLSRICEENTNYDDDVTYDAWYHSGISGIICDLYDVNLILYQLPMPTTQLYYKSNNNNVSIEISWKTIHIDMLEPKKSSCPTIHILNVNACHYMYLNEK